MNVGPPPYRYYSRLNSLKTPHSSHIRRNSLGLPLPDGHGSVAFDETMTEVEILFICYHRESLG